MTQVESMGATVERWRERRNGTVLVDDVNESEDVRDQDEAKPGS